MSVNSYTSLLADTTQDLEAFLKYDFSQKSNPYVLAIVKDEDKTEHLQIVNRTHRGRLFSSNPNQADRSLKKIIAFIQFHQKGWYKSCSQSSKFKLERQCAWLQRNVQQQHSTFLSYFNLNLTYHNPFKWNLWIKIHFQVSLEDGIKLEEHSLENSMPIDRLTTHQDAFNLLKSMSEKTIEFDLVCSKASYPCQKTWHRSSCKIKDLFNSFKWKRPFTWSEKLRLTETSKLLLSDTQEGRNLVAELEASVLKFDTIQSIMKTIHHS